MPARPVSCTCAPARWIVAASMALAAGTVLPAHARQASVPASPPIAAADVSQPDGWDTDLAMARPADLNPAPDVVEINLEAKVTSIEIVPGTATPAWTYNGTVPGPYIRVKVGDRIVVHFTNSLPEPTTIHWHGLRVPNDMDGAPGMTQPPIPPGGTFHYEFVARDAGTYWYHPHQSSSGQVGRGLYGALVVEDPSDPAAFGDDLVLVLSDISLDRDGQFVATGNGGAFDDLFGREGRVLLVNGKVRPRLKVRAGKPQRWRLINASRARYYAMRPDGTLTRIGGDGGLAERATPIAQLVLVPGERLDVVYTPTEAQGTSAPLRWLPVDRGYGTAFGRRSETLMYVDTIDAPAVAPPALPAHLRDIPPIDVSNALRHDIELTIEGQGSEIEMGINGVPSWNAAPLHARVGETHVWTVTNDSAFDHPFHLHGYSFQVLDADGPREWKDTINVPVKSSIRIAVKFDERPGMWMFHCHILDHADAGMMGHLHVE